MMKNRFFKILAILILSNCTIAQAQYQSFVLKDKYNGFETSDKKGYVEIEIKDSTNIDSYVSAIYSTLFESYPRANIQTIGNRGVRMDATSQGIFVSSVEGGVLNMYVDFSIMMEVKEHPDEIGYYRDSLGVKRPYNDYHQVRLYAPVIKKLSFYNPYYHSEVKEYITEQTSMHEALMEKSSTERSYAETFIGEIDIYIKSNINAELNQNFYRTFENGKYFDSLGRKHKRRDK